MERAQPVSQKQQTAEKDSPRKVSIHKYLIINKIEYVTSGRRKRCRSYQASESGLRVLRDLLIDYTNLFVYFDLSR